MANELVFNSSVVFDGTVGNVRKVVSMSVIDQYVNVTTKRPANFTMNASTSAEIIPLADASTITGGWLMLRNLDSTNYVEVLLSTVGAVIGKMFPGEVYGPVRLGSGITAPAVQANTATCEVEVFLCPA